MRVRFTQRDRDDLRTIIEYRSDQNLQGARSVKRALDATINVIEHFPNSGRSIGGQGIRALPVGRYPYLVYWTVQADEVWIVHIRDGRRRPWGEAP
jgi:plasmid stabilization system protein ParE